MKDFFFVYDFEMKNYLSERGHKFVTHARSIKNGREFWLFVRSEKLQVSIDEFKNRKNHVKFNIG